MRRLVGRLPAVRRSGGRTTGGPSRAYSRSAGGGQRGRRVGGGSPVDRGAAGVPAGSASRLAGLQVEAETTRSPSVTNTRPSAMTGWPNGGRAGGLVGARAARTSCGTRLVHVGPRRPVVRDAARRRGRSGPGRRRTSATRVRRVRVRGELGGAVEERLQRVGVRPGLPGERARSRPGASPGTRPVPPSPASSSPWKIAASTTAPATAAGSAFASGYGDVRAGVGQQPPPDAARPCGTRRARRADRRAAAAPRRRAARRSSGRGAARAGRGSRVVLRRRRAASARAGRCGPGRPSARPAGAWRGSGARPSGPGGTACRRG